MKNKMPMILGIISVIILILGIICFFSVNSLVIDENSLAGILSLFGVFAFRIIIVIFTLGLIAAIWIIYGIILLMFLIAKKNKPLFNIIIIVLILSVIAILLINFVYSLQPENNYDYSLVYRDGMNEYEIYKANDKIEVHIEEQVNCVQPPCDSITRKEKIKFSDENMDIISEFINERFINLPYNKIQIFDSNLNEEEKTILDSIIYNDEKLLENIN